MTNAAAQSTESAPRNNDAPEATTAVVPVGTPNQTVPPSGPGGFLVGVVSVLLFAALMAGGLLVGWVSFGSNAGDEFSSVSAGGGDILADASMSASLVQPGSSDRVALDAIVVSEALAEEPPAVAIEVLSAEEEASSQVQILVLTKGTPDQLSVLVDEQIDYNIAANAGVTGELDRVSLTGAGALPPGVLLDASGDLLGAPTRCGFFEAEYLLVSTTGSSGTTWVRMQVDGC